MNITKTFLLFFLLASSVFGEVKAVIKAPTEVLAGTLVFLSNEESIGDNKVWVIPEELKQQSAACGNSVFFALPTPGNYRFGLIVADKSAAIDYTFITIRAVGSVGPGPVDPPPVTPPPVTSSLLPLRKASQVGSSFLGDNETSKRLNIELTRLATSILGKSLPEAKAEVQRGLEHVFATRSYESRKKDWINNWRLQVNDELNKLQITSTADYSTALSAIAGSLCVDGVCPVIR